MKYIFLFICIFFLQNCSFADTMELTNLNTAGIYPNGNYIRQLNYAENKIFNNIKKDETTLSKIDRLELAVFGAIQSGNIVQRITNLYKSCQSIYSENYGPYYMTRNGLPYINTPYPNCYPNHPHYKKHKHTYSPDYYRIHPPIIPSNYQLGTTVRILND